MKTIILLSIFVAFYCSNSMNIFFCRSDNETQCEKFAYDSSMFESSIVTEFDLVCDR